MYEIKPSRQNSCTTGKVRGVNLGGWLVIERWMTPTFFKDIPQTHQGDWGYCEILGKEECSQRLKQHWETWITKQDLVNLYNSGINLVRLPIGYWSLKPIDNEYFIQGAEEYFNKALGWAEEIGLKVIIDFHGHSGSQNGFDNSGKAGPILWSNSTTNVQNSLEVVDIITNKYLTRYQSIVHSFEIIDEPANWGLNMNVLKDFYSEAYDRIQTVVPNTKVVFADAFLPFNYWDEFMMDYPNSIMDTHIYHVFDKNKLNFTREDHLNYAVSSGVRLHNSTYPMIVGEWSLGTARCKTWKNGECVEEDATHNNSPDYHEFARNLFLAQSNAYESNSEGWVFWAAKTENMTEWSYLTALQEGWIPDWSHCHLSPHYSPAISINLPTYSL